MEHGGSISHAAATRGWHDEGGWCPGWWSLLGQPPKWIRKEEEGTTGGYERRGLSLTVQAQASGLWFGPRHTHNA
jgi:hypothetical protein